MKDQNIESFDNMRENLVSNNINPDTIPIILQYNKRDLKNILSIEELNLHLNKSGGREVLEATAINGMGVEDTFKRITKLVLKDISKKHKIDIQPVELKKETVVPAKPVTDEMPQSDEQAIWPEPEKIEITTPAASVDPVFEPKPVEDVWPEPKKQESLPELEHAGALKVRSDDCSVQAMQLFVREVGAGGLDVYTSHGDIVAFLPENAAFEMDVVVPMGKGKNGFQVPITREDGVVLMQGKVHGGGPRVHLETRRGSISLGAERVAR